VSSLDAPGFVLDSVTALDPIGHRGKRTRSDCPFVFI
jgi:hypothetical protein